MFPILMQLTEMIDLLMAIYSDLNFPEQKEFRVAHDVLFREVQLYW